MKLLKQKDKEDFYKFFMGEYNYEQKKCQPSENIFITPNSCILNEETVKYLCSGYISYFKGGNPIAYPYKRVITLEHVFSEISSICCQRINFLFPFSSFFISTSQDNFFTLQ